MKEIGSSLSMPDREVVRSNDIIISKLRTSTFKVFLRTPGLNENNGLTFTFFLILIEGRYGIDFAYGF